MHCSEKRRWRVLGAGLLAGAGVVSATANARIKMETAERPFYTSLAGQWAGALEYRDYSNNRRVSLPTTLDVQSGDGGKSIRLRFVYDDGPGKTIEETQVFTVDPKANTLTQSSDSGVSTGGSKSDVFTLTGLASFRAQGKGRLVLNGVGKENDHPVDERKTISLAGKTLTILKETRQTNAPFQFRNRYTFHRAKKSPALP